jgi:hypothetical protein
MTSRMKFSKSRSKRATLSTGSYRPMITQGNTKAATKNAPSRPLVLLPHDVALTQDPSLPIIRGQKGFNGDHPTGPAFGNKATVPGSFSIQNHDDGDNIMLFNTGITATASLAPVAKSSHQKKAQQAEKWMVEVIPELILPYMDMLKESESLRQESPLKIDPPCRCVSTHELTVSVIRFNGESAH